jgi:hypothetical protein
MAENKKTYVIEIKGIKESYDSLITLNDAIETLCEQAGKTAVQVKSGTTVKGEAKKTTDELTKAQEKLNAFDADYQKQLIEVKNKLAQKTAEVKKAVTIENAALAVEGNLQASYYEKQNLLSALGKSIKSMSVLTDGDMKRQQALKEQYASLNEELKNFDKELGNHHREVGNYEIAGKSLRAELKEAQAQMVKMLLDGVDPLSAEFQELSKRTGEMKDAMGDAMNIINNFADDVKPINDVINVAQTATSVFGLWQGSMSMLGIESESTVKMLEKLQAATTVMNSLSQIQNTLLDQSTLTYRLYHKLLDMLHLSKKKDTAATAGQAAAETGLTAATKASAGAQGLMTKATNALNTAFKSTAIGLLIAGAVMLVTRWQDVVSWFKKSIPVLNDIDKIFYELKAIVAGVGSALVEYCITPVKTLMSVVKGFSENGIKGAMEAGVESFKKGINVIDAFEKGAAGQRIKNEEDRLKRAAGLRVHDTEQSLRELKRQLGSDYEFTQEARKLYASLFEDKLKIYKKDSEDYQTVLDEQADYNRKIAEYDNQIAAEAAAKRKDEAKKRIEDLRKLKEEIAKMLAETVSLHEDNAKDILAVNKKEIEEIKAVTQEQLDNKILQLKLNFDETEKLYNEDFDRQKEIVKKAYDEQIEEAKRLGADGEIAKITADRIKRIEEIETQGQLQEQERLSKFNSEVTAMQDSLNSNIISNTKKSLDSVADTLDDRFQNIKETMLDPIRTGGYFDIIDIDATKEKLGKVSNMYGELAESLNPDGLNMGQISDEWNHYLDIIKSSYGEDSEEFKNAQLEKTNALDKYKQDYEIVLQSLREVQEKEGEISKEFWSDLSNQIGEKFTEINEAVLTPLFDSFTAMMSLELEEAQERLNEVSALHDEAVEKVSSTGDRIKQLNEQMKSASGAELEQLKSNLADEQALLLQRQEEEKRLADEKVNAEAEAAKKEKALKKAELQQELISAIVNTAVAVTKALSLGFPLGIVMAAVYGAMGAIQVATITKQLSKLGTGGLLRGNSHNMGGIKGTGSFSNIEVEGGEFVVNKNSTKKYLPLIQAINEDSTGTTRLRPTASQKLSKMATPLSLNYEGVDSTLSKNNGVNMLRDKIQAINFQPVVSVVDINKGQQRVARVQDIAGK